ncbi:beta-galactosidase [Clostridiales bacterium NSJ-32]|uniref:Beta-galactosidase n=2 Tax=Bianquea renquensis TaxID=2763661 RepID=A0A926DN39_9FIRM|nr:beta-galactosidase [Bianquea renquensis]
MKEALMIPRSEYPRPQFQREESSWQCLNGPWQFAFDFGNSGIDRKLYMPEAEFDREIVVPFCPESRLSGVEYKDFISAVWYRRTIRIAKAQLENRVLLHFGAVDYHAIVYVNGEKAGEHRGGYVSFSFDITALLREGENLLVVYAEDDNRHGLQPKGKQSSLFHSHGCDYTRTTGIWQTVWLEFVPKTYLKSVKTQSDYRNRTVTFTAAMAGQEADATLRACISFEGCVQKEVEVALNTGKTTFTVELDAVKLWDVGQPNLYDVTYTLYVKGTAVDTVAGYFGVRTVELRDHAIYLNGRPVFQRLILDQGFYPDGIYTAPTDEALRRDIELSMELGFNGARLHQKVFEERFLYWADHMGYLVWGEHASWGLDLHKMENLANFGAEWMEIVERDFNHPAIVGWCPFNETWGGQDPRLLQMMYAITKAMDTTRPVIDTSGNYHVVTDIYDIHDYEQDVDIFAQRYGAVTREKVYDKFEKQQYYEGQPYFISEYGGASWNASEGWGYGSAPKTEEEFMQRYAGLTTALMTNEAICAFCYTQLTDVEQEQNGLYQYDRSKKFSDAVYQAIRDTNRQTAAIERR